MKSFTSYGYKRPSCPKCGSPNTYVTHATGGGYCEDCRISLVLYHGRWFGVKKDKDSICTLYLDKEERTCTHCPNGVCYNGPAICPNVAITFGFEPYVSISEISKLPRYIQYEHHGGIVWVDRWLKGKHRDNCLCWHCENMKPEDKENNCPTANKIYDICVDDNMVVCIYECPKFKEKKQ